MINFARDVHAAKIDPEIPLGGPTKLLLKTADGEVTTFLMPHDPLALGAQLSPSVPVWKLNLGNIQSHTYEPHGGPPSMFLSSRSGDVLMFNMSSRSGGRPPIHINADFAMRSVSMFAALAPGAAALSRARSSGFPRGWCITGLWRRCPRAIRPGSWRHVPH